MAISYDDWKKQYDSLDTAGQKKFAELAKNSDLGRQYMNQYISESQKAGTFGTQTAKTSTPTSTQTNTQQNTTTTQNQTNNNGSNGYSNTQTTTSNQGGSSLSDGKNGDGNTYGKFTFDVNEFLDESKFGTGTGVKVQEGTAKDTGRPDYQIESDARLNEMVNNLNTYRQTNPEFFSSREEFNKQFEYNQRQSDAQRALLDSYWKKAQDYKKASSYNNPASFSSDLDSGNVSESEFEALKQYNPEVYMKWQKEMQDKLNAAIANLANPFSIDDTTTALNKLVEKFNLRAGDPYDIIGGWENMMQRTGAWDSMNEAKKHFTAADNAIAQIKRIQSNYSSSTGGNQSDTLVAARLQKATLPYETLLANELSAGQHWQSLYNTQLGTANQYAQTIQMQAKEDERIFQQKLAGLGFAIKAYTTRTPEQQAQLELQVGQISQDMALLNQSKQNDLALYNMAATTRLQNQLNYEMEDLTVTDPKQLRANLSNVLDQYYSQYGDIIKRSKSEVIDDVLAQAKAEGISVSEALRKNFIEPLQGKAEYKNMIRNSYGLGSEVQKIGDTLVGITYDDNGIPQVHYLGNYGDKTASVGTSSNNFTGYNPVASATVSSGLNNFISSHSVGATGGQCGAFVNDYLQSIGLDRLFVDPIDKKKAIKNSDTPTVGSVAIMDSKTSPQYGHVAIVKSVNSDGTVSVIESNWGGDQLVHERNIKTSDIYGYFDPSKQTTQSVGYDPSQGAMYAKFLDGYVPNGPAQEWLKQMGISPQTVMAQAEAWKHDHQKQYITPMLDTIERLIDNYNSTYALVGSTGLSTSWFLSPEYNDFMADFNYLKDNLTLTHLTELKEQGATFGALSDNELNAIGNSATALKLGGTKDKYEKELLNIYNNFLSSAGLDKISLEDLRNRSSSAGETTETMNNFTPVQINMPSYTMQGDTLGSTLTGGYTNWADMFNQG